MITTFAKKRKILKEDKFEIYLQKEKKQNLENQEIQFEESRDLEPELPKRRGTKAKPAKQKSNSAIGELMEPTAVEKKEIQEKDRPKMEENPAIADVFSMLLSQSPTKKRRKVEMKIRNVSQSTDSPDLPEETVQIQEKSPFLNDSQNSNYDESALEKILMSDAFESKYKASHVPGIKKRGNTYLSGSQTSTQNECFQSQQTEIQCDDDLDETEIDEGLESSDDDVPKIKAYHHLKESGNKQMILDEIEYLLNGLNSKTLKVKRNSLYELYYKLKGDFMNMFSIHGYPEKLFNLLSTVQDATLRIPLTLIFCKIKSELKQSDFCRWLLNSIDYYDQWQSGNSALAKKKQSDIAHKKFLSQLESDFKTVDIREIIVRHLAIPQLHFKDIVLSAKQVDYFKSLILENSALIYPVIVKMSKDWKHVDTIIPFYEALDSLDINGDEFTDVVSILINLYCRDNIESNLPDLNVAKLFIYIEKNIPSDTINLITCLLINIATVKTKKYTKKQIDILKKNLTKDFPTNAYTSILMGSIYIEQKFSFDKDQALANLEEFYLVQSDIGIQNNQVLDLINQLKDLP
ncbi:hypothetical protein HDV04_002121 [Boothiomyces sp. JEL0838]|nr:hypothetical protein HDV04_002121 [Boothiomyces sp. JEL0838]